MILLVYLLAQWQILFSVWVDFPEQKWVILAERRGTRSRGIDYAAFIR
jgi:excisionase family DNA binding protein